MSEVARRPSFDHRDAGTPAAAWTAAIDALPAWDGVGGHDHLVVLAAHPDDETLGAGGLLADAARAGAQLTVVVATDGEASHPASPTHAATRLAPLRRDEFAAAVGRLAPRARLVTLGLPDGALAANTDALDEALRAHAGDATVVAAPWSRDGHPDHDACGAAAAHWSALAGARLVEYPIWAWHWGQPGRSGALLDGHWATRRMSEAARAAKTAALAEYRTQHTALSPRPGDEPVLDADLLEHFATRLEVFRVAPAGDLPGRYFERLYENDPDPWGLDRSFYEDRKRALLLGALPRPRFRRAFEPGCALGLNTLALAGRCDEVVAADVSAAAVRATRDRVRGAGNVTVSQAGIPEQWPAGEFDLVVLSEVGYYLADADGLAQRAARSLTPDGVVLACHWRRPAPGYPSSAEAVHDALARLLPVVATHREADFLLDVFARDGRSVAETCGVLG